MRVKDFMNKKVETIPSSAPVEDARAKMRTKRIHHLVVLQAGKTAGILSARDLGGARSASSRQDLTVADVMTPYLVSAHTGTTVREAANLLRGHTIGCLPVLEDGKLAGIVTVTDLLELLGRGYERPAPKGERRILKRNPRARRR